jgi:ribosomal protein L37AE/L43A
MKIIEITYRNRNDFKAIYECEHCGDKFEAWGYNDSNYFNNVMPNATCDKCGLNSKNETKEETVKRLGRDYEIYRDRD